MSANSGQKGSTEQEAEIGKDSLKVKIKLNKSNISKTDSSMEDISPVDHLSLTEKPLKIKIRKNDLITSSPSVNNTHSNTSMELSNARILGLATFPKLEPISFPQLQRVSGVTPEQFSDWSDRDVNLLKEELENIKKNIKDFTTSLQNQLDILESAKDKKESLICKPYSNLPSTPLSNSMLLSNSSTNSINSPISSTTVIASPLIKKDPLPIATTPISSTTSTTPSSSKVKSEPKRRYRKRKKHGEGTSDEDEQFEETQDSEIEDEIDVVNDVDVEDAEYIDAPLDNENNNKSGPRQGKIIRKRNTQGRNKKNVGKNRQNKSNYIKKNKASSSSSQPKSDDNDSDELELTQLPRPPGKIPSKHNFWIDMEPYFVPFTEEDLKLLTHQTLDPEDSAFIIPPLGKPRADSILQQQQQQQQQSLVEEAMLEETSSVSSSVKSESKVEEDKGLHCGDLTSRVLAALIEEKIVPNSTSVPTLTSNSNSFSLKPSKENSIEDSSTSDTSCLPITTPPVYDFSQTSIVNLEERIKLELKAIGLLEEDINIDSNNREDDEICSELRLLQHQLREHVNISNRIRSKLYDSVKNAIDIQEKERKERVVEEALEQQYVKSQKKKKRKSNSSVT